MNWKDLPARRAAWKIEYTRRRQEGLCVDCGKNPATVGVYCQLCYAALKKYERSPARIKARRIWESQYHKQRRKDKPVETFRVQQSYYVRELIKRVMLLGGKCVSCGITNPLVLTVNHKYGRRGPKPLTCRQIFNKLSKEELDTSQFDLRCFNCNQLYEYQRKRLLQFIDISQWLDVSTYYGPQVTKEALEKYYLKPKRSPSG